MFRGLTTFASSVLYFFILFYLTILPISSEIIAGKAHEKYYMFAQDHIWLKSQKSQNYIQNYTLYIAIEEHTIKQF